jgi:hypothetical protein
LLREVLGSGCDRGPIRTLELILQVVDSSRVRASHGKMPT